MYDSSLKYKWDNQNVLDYAVKEADTKAREEEQMKALQERKAIARELKKEGLIIAFIAKTTKLSIEEIEKL